MSCNTIHNPFCRRTFSYLRPSSDSPPGSPIEPLCPLLNCPSAGLGKNSLAIRFIFPRHGDSFCALKTVHCLLCSTPFRSRGMKKRERNEKFRAASRRNFVELAREHRRSSLRTRNASCTLCAERRTLGILEKKKKKEKKSHLILNDI